MMKKGRLTIEGKIYNSEFLRKLQAYEDLGSVEEFETLKNGVKKEKIYVHKKFNGNYAAEYEDLGILKKARAKKGFTFVAIGAITGINRNKIGEMFAGKAGAAILWRKLEKVLDVDIVFIG